jgi:hypothetical protein
MAKSSGLGNAFWLGGNDISGDTQQYKLTSPIATFDFTDITESAFERGYGRRDAQWNVTTFFNPTRAHPVLSALPTADTLATIATATTLGSAAACMQAKQVNYDPTRDSKGMLTFAVQLLSNGYGYEWGLLQTPGIRTDTAATNGTSWNWGAATNFGAQAYLQMTAFTGTDVTIKLQDSADNTTFADVTNGAFAQVTSSTPGWQRIALANNATLRQYVRVSTVTTGGFTSASFAVVVNRNTVAGVVF